MLQFSKVEKENLLSLRPYFAVQNTHIADFSLGFQFMWHKHLASDFAVWGDCLVLREFFAGKHYFYFPISLSGSEEKEKEAIIEIERYCRDNDIRLHFTNIPRRAVPSLLLRYNEASVTDIRRWRDYLYDADSFRFYGGKAFSGQRNHVNKFKKNYDWSFRPLGEDDLPSLLSFLEKYGSVQREKHEYLADAELDEVYEILPRIGEYGLLCGGLYAGGELIGFSVGERCGDMIVVHIEKAFREYEGAYPMLAQQFAIAFGGEAKYFNRMDDAGDLGLRKSKLQYHPCELVDKYNFVPARAIDGISHMPTVETERLVLAPVQKKDEAAYARLASDVSRNLYWGYDWREDRKNGRTPPPSWFLKGVKEDFHRRMELSLGIFCGETLMGEVVLHRFGYHAEAEIGVRLLPEAEGKGYACEAVRALTDYAFSKYNLERMEAKCFCENTRSRAMLERAGMRYVSSDGTYFHFLRTPEM